MKKKTIAMGLLLCTLLCGCSVNGGTESPDTTDGEGATTVKEETAAPLETAGSDEQTRIAYYEHLVNELQQELLSMKTELYVSRVEYESRIAELEAGKATEESTTAPDEPSATPDPSPMFLYTVENGAATVTSYIGTDKQVKIPATLGGYPVRSIGDGAFQNNSDLTSVIIPEGVTYVGWFAFAGCVALDEAVIPASVESIAYGAFQNCNSKMTVRCVSGSYAEQYARSYGMKIAT